MKYRFAGKEKSLSIGVYPDVSMADTLKCNEAEESSPLERSELKTRKEEEINPANES